MPEITEQNLRNRLIQIRARLGALAYDRRDYELKIERIDEEVAQLEAQQVMLEATQNDLLIDETNEKAEIERKREDARQRRSEAAKRGKAKAKAKAKAT